MIDLISLTQEDFADLFSAEMRKIGSNAAVIRKNLANEGKTDEEISKILSSYFKSLGIKLNESDIANLEKELILVTDSLNLKGSLTKEDFQIVGNLFKKYNLQKLEVIIAILQTPTSQMHIIENKIAALA